MDQLIILSENAGNIYYGYLLGMVFLGLLGIIAGILAIIDLCERYNLRFLIVSALIIAICSFFIVRIYHWPRYTEIKAYAPNGILLSELPENWKITNVQDELITIQYPERTEQND